MSKKCPQCGLVNFADADVCKKCNGDLTAVASQPSSSKKSSSLAGLIVIVALVALVCSFWLIGGRANTPPAAIADTPSPVAQATPEKISSRNVESARKALDAIYKLQSATEAGLTFYQYSERVLDTKAEVDAALRAISAEETSDTFFKQDIDRAMYFYIEARDGWSDSIRNDYSEEGRNKLLNAAWAGAREQIKFAEDLLPER